MGKYVTWPKEQPGKKVVEKFWMKEDRNHQKKYNVTASLQKNSPISCPKKGRTAEFMPSTDIVEFVPVSATEMAKLIS